MHIGEKKIFFNDNEYSLQDEIIKKGDTLYVPDTVFTDYFKYKYKWNSELNAAYFTDTAIGNNYLPKRYSYIDKKGQYYLQIREIWGHAGRLLPLRH